eukprot:CAMPEP_0198140488 /NCGR_PEP_ID=MMETSP1443-20131203/3631_1 /TAXON_ID=186043 /ORGANISM="Entomoneis sp., Strain CCMP2396" /LENGTH=126 /DNA_ID=CAMNT_0043802921 /DNA_START=63 /DNA_END=443 /DNA_ORIENTATION=-
MKSFIACALIASASAFAPTQPAFARVATSINSFEGKFEGQVWDVESKQDVYASWDPNAARSPLNFNPFETFEGNSPNPSGFFPGEGRYKDPMRPDVSYAQMQVERAILDDVAANPKASPGCAGCKN